MITETNSITLLKVLAFLIVFLAEINLLITEIKLLIFLLGVKV